MGLCAKVLTSYGQVCRQSNTNHFMYSLRFLEIVLVCAADILKLCGRVFLPVLTEFYANAIEVSNRIGQKVLMDLLSEQL